MVLGACYLEFGAYLLFVICFLEFAPIMDSVAPIMDFLNWLIHYGINGRSPRPGTYF